MVKTFSEIGEKTLTEQIKKILEKSFTKKLVRRYFNPQINEPFSGSLFHTLGINDANRFGNDDLLSLNLLDESVSARQIKELTTGKFDQLLHALCDSYDVTQLDGDAYKPAIEIWDALSEIHGFGPTRVSKLLARKRPNLIPIRDSIVNKQLQIEGYSWWKSLAATMRHSDVKESLEDLCQPIDMCDVPHLRVLDVAIWMHGSQSKAARKVRLELGMFELPNKLTN
jgi:hypothetical protein